MAKKFSHEILMQKNNLKASDLSAKIQSLLTKFANATDDEDKETYNDKLFDLIDDHIEEQKAAAKKKEESAEPAAAGKKKDDVSGAPTAKKKDEPAPATHKKEEHKKEESSFLARRFGR